MPLLLEWKAIKDRTEINCDSIENLEQKHERNYDNNVSGYALPVL